LALDRLLAESEGYWIARTLAALGSVALHQGRTEEALEVLRRSLGVSSLIGDRDNLAWAIELVGVAYAHDQDPSAARVLGAADALREDLGNTLEGVELALHEGALAELRNTLAPEVLATAWAAGRALSPDRVLSEVLAPR
jgi:hypothetical protein